MSPNKAIFVRPRLINCANKTGCFQAFPGHTLNFVRLSLNKFIKISVVFEKFEISLFCRIFLNTAWEATLKRKTS